MDINQRYNQEKALKLYYQMQYAPFLLKSSPSPLTEPFYQAIIQLLKKYINADSRVIEIGCGLGRVMFEAQKLGMKSGVGTDISEAFIEESKKIQSNDSDLIDFHVDELDKTLTFEVGDIQILKYSKNEFNFAICLNVIDRLADPLLAVYEIGEFLEKDGLLIVCLPYDWLDDVTPLLNQVADLHILFPRSKWEVLEEIKNLSFEIFSKPRKNIHYDNHLLVLRKK